MKNLFLVAVVLMSFKHINAQTENLYKTVKIDKLNWATENLRATKFNNGDAIPIAKNLDDWKNAAIQKKPIYGIVKKNNRIEYVYNFYVLMDKRGVLPKGFSFPSDDDYQNLQNALQANTALLSKINFQTVGVYSFNRRKNSVEYESQVTIFWYKDNSSIGMEKEYDMGTSYGIFENEECKNKFPANCDGSFYSFDTFYEIGGSDAGNGFSVRLIKKY